MNVFYIHHRIEHSLNLRKKCAVDLFLRHRSVRIQENDVSVLKIALPDNVTVYRR